MNLRDQLQGIYENRGELTPGIVVDEARDPRHPLHARFEWDDSVAGEAWRREQARELIRTARIVYREATEDEAARSVRAFQSVPKPTGRSYEPTEKVAADPISRELVVRQMRRDIEELRRRYAEFDEFWQLLGELANVG